MKQRKLTLVLILAALAIFSVSLCFGQNQAKERAMRVRFPDGHYTIKLVPYAGPGSESAPLRVTFVDGKVVKHSSWVNELRLQNNSDKAVDLVEYTLYIYDEQKPDTVLFTRRIPGSGFAPGFPPNTEFPDRKNNKYKEQYPYPFAMLPAGDLLTPMLEDKVVDGKYLTVLEGHYLMAFAVSEVRFEDGTRWKLDDGLTSIARYDIPGRLIKTPVKP